jgi:hypothetical protein
MLTQAQLLYQITPIILTGGIASNISGGMLPLLSFTNPEAFGETLLTGNPDFSFDDAFAIFQPAVGGTLVEQLIAQYPFANLSVAANAIIRNPINISMIMITPMKQESAWAVKLATMTALQATLNAHNNAGGTYTVCTPAYTYFNMLMTGLTDVSVPQSPIPQNAWRWDFTKPLVSLTDVQGAMNNLMNQISNGVAPSGGGPSTTTGTATALVSTSSSVNLAAGAGGTPGGYPPSPLTAPIPDNGASLGTVTATDSSGGVTTDPGGPGTGAAPQ